MTCPICEKPTNPAFKPFCCRRCAEIDLSRWLKGSYAIPGAPAGDEDGQSTVDGAESRENRGLGRPDKGMDRE
jgi:endogenous inhibitor of DNA gyrase (YacG/DUF329 family)